jgi:hypothetical protein
MVLRFLIFDLTFQRRRRQIAIRIREEMNNPVWNLGEPALPRLNVIIINTGINP